jgi:hypothetical protein
MSDYLPPNRNSWPTPATHPCRDALACVVMRARREAEMEADRLGWTPYSDMADECGTGLDDPADVDVEAERDRDRDRDSDR